jgi:hypothetical protein
VDCRGFFAKPPLGLRFGRALPTTYQDIALIDRTEHGLSILGDDRPGGCARNRPLPAPCRHRTAAERLPIVAPRQQAVRGQRPLRGTEAARPAISRQRLLAEATPYPLYDLEDNEKREDPSDTTQRRRRFYIVLGQVLARSG